MASSFIESIAVDIETAPARAATFLHGIGALPTVFAQLELAGMTCADVAEGKRLLFECLGGDPEPCSDEARRRRGALLALDEWEEANVGRYGAALKRRAPTVHAYVFRDLRPARDAFEAAQRLTTFLERITALERGTDVLRGGSVVEDAEAMRMLEARGLTHEVRQRLTELIGPAFGSGGEADVLPPSEPRPVHSEKLRALEAWVDEWTETARALVKRPADMQRLGLVARGVAA